MPANFPINPLNVLKCLDCCGELVGGLGHVLFFHLLGIVIPTDFHIFQWVTASQLRIVMAIFDPSENFCDREKRPGGFFDGWDRRISAHLGILGLVQKHGQNLLVCQCLSFIFKVKLHLFFNCNQV